MKTRLIEGHYVKTLLAFGGLTLGGLAAKDQTATSRIKQLLLCSPTAGDVLQDQKLADAKSKRSATMEEIAKLRDPITPQALRALKPGARFGGRTHRPELAARQLPDHRANAVRRNLGLLGQPRADGNYYDQVWAICLSRALPETSLIRERRAASTPSNI